MVVMLEQRWQQPITACNRNGKAHDYFWNFIGTFFKNIFNG